ncbi:MAG: DUF4105 domain-containing protein [Nitrospiria bacterium]
MLYPALLALAVILNLTPDALASPSVLQENRDLLGPRAQVFLVTIGPGDLVWERFGHNGLWIKDSERGFNRLYHWGLFSFRSKDFWPRYLRGRMQYAMGSIEPERFVAFHAGNDRSIWVQELRLSSDQKNALARFLRGNDTDENRFYRYDYYLDNCSTRARDALDRVLGGVIARAMQLRGTGESFRSHTRRLLQGVPAAYLGIQLVMGNPADREISVWEETFTPMALRRRLNEVSLPDGSSLVLADQRVYRSSSILEPTETRSFLPVYSVVGVSAGLLVAFLGYATAAGGKWARAGLALVGTAWGLLAGMVGMLLLLAWLFTDHRFWYWNENLLQVSPLSLGAAFLFPMLLMRGHLPRGAEQVSYAIAVLSITGLVLQAGPGFDQVNAEVIVLALPIHLGLAWAARHTRAAAALRAD